MTNDSVARVCALMTLTILVPAVAIAQQPSTSIPLPATQYKLSRLAPGQTAGQAVFPVDDVSRVTVQILSNDGGLDTSILGPAAQLINPTNIDAFGGVYTTASGAAADSPLLLSGPSAGFEYVYSFPSLGAGTYTVRFSTTSADEVAVITQVTTDSRIGAALLATDATLVLGNPAVLTAAIFDGATPVTGANVAVTVVHESGAPLNVMLGDDGRAGDDMPGDGLYSGEFIPAATGKYVASAVITGTTNRGVSFTRHGGGFFTVIPKTSALAGTFVDDGVDDNRDGLFDRVSILVHTATTKEGTYRAFVHLSTALGQTLVRTGEANLLTTSQGITVNVEADAFLRLHENGPYNIDLIELLFVDAGGAMPADTVAEAGQTRRYQLSEFQRPLVALTGVKSDEVFDDNGNGKFDRLVVSLQVDVVRAGFYSWGFKLSDQRAREIDFGSGFGFFDVGLNQLRVTFEGAKVGAFGVNGPYQLRDLLVQGPGASLVMTDIGRTQAYRVSQFEGARNNQPPIADAGPDQTIEATGPTTSVVLDGSASSDPDGDPLTYEWRDSAGRLVASTATANVSLPFGAQTFTLTVDDGRSGTATDEVTITIRDTTPPTINCGSPDGRWHGTDVSIACTASDSGSGLANPADASFSLMTSVPPGTETANAATSRSIVCDVSGNCAAAGPIAGNMVDKKAPAVVVTRNPAANANAWNNTDVIVTFTASDGGSGVAGPPVVTIPFTKSGANQSSIQTFTDNVGNTVMIDSGMAIGAINIDRTPPDAFNQFDPVKKDVAVFGRDTLSGTASDPIAPVSVTRAHWKENDDDGDHDGGKAGDNGGRPGHEDPQFNAELRTYLIIDNAGNTLRLVELVSIQGHDMKVRVVSFQYNDGSIVLAGRNEKQFEWKTDKTGTLKGIEQLMSVGGRPLTHLVQAEWEAKTNRTVIQVTDEKQDVPERDDDKKCEHGQHDKKIVKPGLVLLRMAIIDRKLVIEY